jgi:antitoxin VapB
MRTAKVFMNGQSQAVRLPKDCRFSGKEVYVNKIGNAVVLIAEDDAMATMLAGIDSFTDDFMAHRNQGKLENRDEAFK